MSINFQVIGLTRLGIKPKSTAPVEPDLAARLSDVLNLSRSNIKVKT